MQHKSQPRATSTETKKNAHRFKDKGSKAKTTNKVISNAFNNTIAKEEGFTQSCNDTTSINKPITFPEVKDRVRQEAAMETTVRC